MTNVNVLLVINGASTQWTSGYQGIDDLTLRRLQVETSFALRSIQLELLARETGPTQGSTTQSTSERAPVESTGIERAKKRVEPRAKKLGNIYKKIQNTANTMNERGLSDYTFTAGSIKAQSFETTLRNILETVVVPDHENWGWKTRCALLTTPTDLRRLNALEATSILLHMVQNRGKLFVAKLQEQFEALWSGGHLYQRKRKRADSNLDGDFDAGPYKQHITSCSREIRSSLQSDKTTEMYESATVEDANRLEQDHQVCKSQKNIDTATCTTTLGSQPNTLQVDTDCSQLHAWHDQSHAPSVYPSETIRSQSFACQYAATFNTGISVENTFNRNSTLMCERPYESAIFAAVQDGDMPQLRGLLESGNGSIHDVDPYGLGLLYYASYYCWKAHGPSKAMPVCSWLVSIGVNTLWKDDIGNNPRESMLDSALVYTAMSGGSVQAFGQLCLEIGALFNLTLSDCAADYLETRKFGKLHQVLLRIDQTVSLEDYLHSLSKSDRDTLFTYADSRKRTPLMWAVEFGWSDATRILLKYGADPYQATSNEKGNSTLLHLALAGPRSQFSNAGFMEVVAYLLERKVDFHARDHEGWTPRDIAISWGTSDLFNPPGLDWSVVTNEPIPVNTTCPVEQFTEVAD